MGRWQWCCRAATGTLTATVIAAGGLAAAPAASAATQICRSSTSANAALAAKMSQDIKNAYQGRSSVIGLHVDYPSLGLLCSYNSAKHFYAASTVKAIILAALLRKAEEQNRSLTSSEKSEATLMITQSDNTAATQLWNDVGMSRLQHFLNLAQMTHTVLGKTQMTHTVLGKNGYWGLTQETAYDESLLLQRLVTPNSVLTTSDRDYELNLMAKVISSQRWGTPAGVPTSYTVHVKNGWLPVSGYGWIINSLGAFTKSGPDYTMDVLTDGNKNSMQYGITTIEDIATKVNHDLNAGASSTVARSARAATWGVPDESIPASMTPGH